MKKQWFVVMILGLALTGCGTLEVQGQILDPTENVQTQVAATEIPTQAPTSSPTATATQEAQLSFEAVTYEDAEAGFVFEHPADWGIGFSETQARGSIVQLQDASGPRLDVTLLLWEPVQDLPAFIDVRLIAWESSGIDVKEAQDRTLNNGQAARQFVVEGPDGSPGFFFFAPIGERYLVLSGSGDIDLLKEVASTVRILEGAAAPVEDETEAEDASEGEPLDCAMVTDASDMWVPCNVRDGITSRNLSALHGYMTNPFTIGYWGSEGRDDTPVGITQELLEYRLPADTSTPMTFTSERAAFPPLGSMPLEGMFGSEHEVALVLYSEGWGPQGEGAALLYFEENPQGNLVWFAMVYSEKHFDK